jgi:hypothetical protein
VIVPVASSTLYLAQRRDGAVSASLEEFGGDGNSGIDHMEAVAPHAPSQGAMPSSTPQHRHGGGASLHHHEHAAPARHHGSHHPLVARHRPEPVHHHGAAHGKHAKPSPSADVSPHAFASGMGATMPAPSSPQSPLDRPHVTHHHESTLYPSQQGALNVRNQTANANLAKERHAAAVAARHPASTPSAPSKGTPTRDDPRGLRGYIREQAAKHGVNPDTAVKGAEHEGLRDFLGDYHKGTATSAGAFQLHKGGLADQFQKDTGLDPFDPKNERATIDWSMAHAGKTKSWKPWHGARRAGIGEHEGFSSGEGASPAASPGGATPRGAGGSIPLSGGAATRADSLTGMQPEFRARLAAMFRDAPRGSSVFSGYRSPELQRELYNAPHRPGYVARPGHSHHGAGDAADLRGNLDWFHAHAPEYGLHFPMSFERWHIQSDPNTRVPVPQGGPSDAASSTPRPAPSTSTALAAARARLARK